MQHHIQSEAFRRTCWKARFARAAPFRSDREGDLRQGAMWM